MSKNKNFYFKRQRAGLVVVAGFAVILMAFSVTTAFAGLVAQITNSVNSASTGSLVMKETNENGDVVCKSTDSNTSNAATCAGINKYGGVETPLAPGQSKTTKVKISNIGTIDATTFTINGGECTSSNVSGVEYSGASDLCEKINVTIKSGETEIYKGTAKQFAGAGAQNILAKITDNKISPNQEVEFSIIAELDNNTGNEYQGKQISQPIVWQFGA